MDAPPTSASFAVRPRTGVWRLALVLAVAVFVLVVFENRQYLFATQLYENTDQASDSLMVREAKRSFLLHGHYSQWRFYHPGPALLDTLAVGEAVFYDTLHLVPTPYNGQLLALCAVLTLFFGLALAIFARQLGPEQGGQQFFLPLALLFALWHFGAVGGQVFLEGWPAYPLVMATLCFVVTTAAVASGWGWGLPLVAFTGGWLVHNHVAQPLFVVPLTLLAYAGLLIGCRRERGGKLFFAGWRTFPRAHLVATGILALFILPLALDALHGKESNLARILEFLRGNHDPGKKFSKSVCYFLTYGAHTTYDPSTRDFGRYTAAGMLDFVSRHWRVYGLWLACLFGAPALFFAASRRRRESGQGVAVAPWQRFVRWFYALTFTAVALTLIWGTRQNGPMYYYNAFFNYALYFCAALGFAAAMAVALTAWTFSSVARRLRPAISGALWLAAVVTTILQTHRFRVSNFGTPEDATMARTVREAAVTLPKDGFVFLDCRPWAEWQDTVAVALELERLGHKARVNDNWEIIFGDPLTVRHESIGAGTPLARWVVVPSDQPTTAALRPVLGGNLEIKELPELNPNGGGIRFSRDGNFDDFAYFGWSPSEGDWAWSDQRNALLAFRPLPLPPGSGGVELVVNAWTSPPPGKTDLQRVIIQFGDMVLGTLPLPLLGPEVQPLRVPIPVKLWQEAVARGEAKLRFRFPDAKSPSSLGLGADQRLLGGGFRSIELQLTPP